MSGIRETRNAILKRYSRDRNDLENTPPSINSASSASIQRNQQTPVTRLPSASQNHEEGGNHHLCRTPLRAITNHVIPSDSQPSIKATLEKTPTNNIVNRGCPLSTSTNGNNSSVIQTSSTSPTTPVRRGRGRPPKKKFTQTDVVPFQLPHPYNAPSPDQVATSPIQPSINTINEKTPNYSFATHGSPLSEVTTVNSRSMIPTTSTSQATTVRRGRGRPPKDISTTSDVLPFRFPHPYTAPEPGQGGKSSGKNNTPANSKILSGGAIPFELPIQYSSSEQNEGHNFGTGISTNTGGTSGEFNSNNDEMVRDLFKGISPEYRDIGDPDFICESCHARLWRSEAKRGNKDSKKRVYSLCCYNGKVELPNLHRPPQMLLDLYSGRSDRSKNFLENIRRYNMMFSFTSMGGKIDHSVNNGRGPYVYRMCGQNYHLAGSLLPEDGGDPKFCQLYIYDTVNEVRHRIAAYSSSGNNSASTSYSLEESTVTELKGLLDVVNNLVKQFRMARDRFDMNTGESIRLRLIGRRDKDGRTYNLPTADEVAALVIGDIDGTCHSRDIILETHSRQLQRVNELHPSYLALQYPLLFPFAEDGYRSDIFHRGVLEEDESGHIKLTLREFFAYRLQIRVGEISLILMLRKLLQQFIVDAYTMVENTRLNYIRNNQKTFRVSSLNNLYNVQEAGNIEVSDVGTRVILPSSFTGGARYMQQNYLDAMAIVKTFGYPDLFITITCNPNWPEILRFCESEGQKPQDKPDIITRAFKAKLDDLISQIKYENVLGKVIGVVYTIEFQKRGLPHCHICLFLDKKDKLPNPSDIDRVISAEIPNKEDEPELYTIVSEHMMHGPCGKDNPKCPCMKNKKCSKHFPKDFTCETHMDESGYPVYRRRRDGNVVMKGTTPLDNRHVVLHNKTLLKQYQAHMNVEWCNQLGSIKYLFKYINKGPDRISVSFEKSDNDNGAIKRKRKVNEIDDYYSCRYVSACEACWRLFNFDIVYRTPAVYRLPFHLPNHQPIVFDADDNIDSVLSKPSVGTSQFIEWMECNKTDSVARELTYVEFPTKFVWNAKIRRWTRRTGLTKSVGRINYVPPKSGETYYLRILLNKVKGPTSFEDIRTVDKKLNNTFKEACFAMGLLDDDKEYIESIRETHRWASGDFCRDIFVSMITSDSLSRHEHVWNETRDELSEDLIRWRHEQAKTLGPESMKHVGYNLALVEIEKLLNRLGTSLRHIPNMPLPDYEYIEESENMLIQDELNYEIPILIKEHDTLFSSMTDEQKSVYSTIMSSVSNDDGGLFFLYGYGSTGKTFVRKTLSAAIRSQGEIVINVASSGIAALLLTGGRTAHSRFHIPINLVEDSFCSIAPDSDLSSLLNKAKLIIWDEAPMMHKHCFEAFDRTMKDIIRTKNSSKPFGGKVVVFGGGFRQILPVIPKGTRADIVHASLHSSYLWRYCKVLKLTKNMRLQSGGSPNNVDEIKEFAEWILKIGEGKIDEPNDGEADVVFPEDVLLPSNGNHLEAMVNYIYPSVGEHTADPAFFQDKAILVPTNEEVDAINEHVLSLLYGDERVYLSSDRLCPEEDANAFQGQLYSPEVLNGLKVPGIPHHRLVLKIGAPIMLLRNMDQAKGLCNGTRLQVVRLFEHTIEARIITGTCFGNYTYIHRMPIVPTDKRIPVRFQRRQFPISVCFAMTINKSQGQSLSSVGLFLRKPVFTHGQLYVAVSRVTTKKGLKVLICDDSGNTTNITKNVVYKEVLRSI